MAAAPNNQHFTLSAGADARGERLDVWLHRQMPQHSRAFLQKLILDGHVQVRNILPRTHPPVPGRPPKPNYRLRPGDSIRVTVPPATPSEVAPEPIALDVLYEDADLVVVNKAPGLVAHPAAGHRAHTLVNALLHHCCGQLSGIGGVERPGIVHRLDRDTSGCLVAAKNDPAHRGLAAQFKARRVTKTYLALVWGVPRLNRGRIEGAIGRSPHHRQKMAVVPRGGREAVTEFEVVRAYGDVALVRCRLHTGRTHQIRVHLAAIGHAIVGDKIYGRARRHLPAGLVTRQMLHAETLAFDHPRTQKPLEFTAPLPQDMRQVIRALEDRKQDSES